MNILKKAFGNTFADLELFILHNKPLILFSLFLAFVLIPLAEGRRDSRTQRDLSLLHNDPALRIVQGERFKKTNAVDHWIGQGKGTFGGRYLALDTKSLPSTPYILFSYGVSVPSDGVYKIFIAASPPGPLGPKGYDFSPYDVVIDDAEIVGLNQEKKDAFLMGVFENLFYSHYVYASGMTFTKVGEFHFLQGEHVIEFRISRREPYEQKYAFLLDAIFLVPKEWAPKRPFFTLPDDLFSY